MPDILEMKFDASRPMYAQLADRLKDAIRSGELKCGDKLISETIIADRLGISRTTVRIALDELVGEGLITRYRGKGTFVTGQKRRFGNNFLYNSSDIIARSGAVPSAVVLRCEVGEHDVAEQYALGLNSGSKRVFVLERLRLADGQPLSLEKACVPYYLCPGIEKFDFSERSLYGTLKDDYHIDICRASETIEAVLLPKDVAQRLGCRPGDSAFRVERFTRMPNGYICEHAVFFVCGDRCRYELELTGDARLDQNNIGLERRILGKR